MDTVVIGQILEKWSTFAILAFILYYFLVVYIPKKDEAYEKRIDGMMVSFENAIKTLSESHENLAKTLDGRLLEIEKVIKK